MPSRHREERERLKHEAAEARAWSHKERFEIFPMICEDGIASRRREEEIVSRASEILPRVALELILLHITGPKLSEAELLAMIE